MESRRRVVAGLAIAAVVLIVAGVVAVAIDSGSPGADSGTGSQSHSATPLVPPSIGTPSPSATPPTPSASAPATPSGGPSPSESPTASGHPLGFAVEGKSIIYYSPDGTTVPMEPVAGLLMKLVDGRGLYYAAPSNPYGLKSGAYAGEFVPNVTTAQADGSSAQTGGIVVVGAVANQLITNALAAIAAPAERWIVALPVDIRGAARNVDVSFDSFGLHGLTDTPRVVVRFSGKLPVVNVIQTNAGYHVLVEQLTVTAWQVIDPTRLNLSTTKLDPDHMMNELLVYGNGAPSVRGDIRVDRRVPIGRVMLTAADEVSVSLVAGVSRADLGPNRVLKVADVPVFVASS